MADWATISSLATAGGTLVLAVATFQAVKSSNRSARIAEVALQEQRRPLLAQSRNDDPRQRIMFGDQHWVTVEGSRGAAEHVDGIVYLVMSLRNIGAGIGVCQAWSVRPGLERRVSEHVPEDQLRPQLRDLYSDQAGEQRTISRYNLVPFAREEGEEVSWMVSGTRHWYLDRAGPR